MTPRQRDARRSVAYLAEELAFEDTVLAERPGGPSLHGALETVLAAQWWRAQVGDPGVVQRIHVRTATDSHWAPATGTLALDPGETWFVVTHELAHVAAGNAPDDVHGPSWRGWNATLVGAVFGQPFGRRLTGAFADVGLPVSLPDVPPPPEPLVRVVPTEPRRGGWRPVG